jgi:hypothetical protein
VSNRRKEKKRRKGGVIRGKEEACEEGKKVI